MSIVLKDRTAIDWALITLFYAGVHYVEAYLATIGQHVRSHQTRDNIMGRDRNLRNVFKNHGDLKSFGYTARYETSTFAASIVEDASSYLSEIKTHLEPFCK